MILDISDNPNLEITVSSKYLVSEFMGDYWQVEVPLGAESISGRVLIVELCDAPMGAAYVDIALPEVDAVSVSCSASELTHEDNLSATTFGIPSGCQLSVVLHFADRTKEMTSDYRTV